MSGYLQRLVGNVTYAASSVHPRTGSIYSQPRFKPESPLEVPEGEEALTSTAFESAPQARPTEQHHSVMQEFAAPDALLPKEPSKRSRQDETSLKKEEKNDASLGLVVQRKDGGESVIEENVVGLPVSRLRADAERTHADVAEQQYRPLIPPARGTEGKARVAATRTEQPQPRHVATPEPDEIQVHIGRIEITAVPAPVQQLPAKAPDKSISLDAYLNRRSGRAR